MFETDIGREKSNEVVSRKWALYLFGAMALVYLCLCAAIYWRQRLTVPWKLADSFVVFALSLYWFMDVLRHGTLGQKAFGWRMMVLAILPNIPFWISMFRM
jgi:hypothetical protein